MNKTLCLVAITAMIAISADARSLTDFHPKLSGPSPVVGQDKIEAADTDGEYGGMDPIAGRSLLSVFLTDIINVVTAPGAVSYAALLFDLFNFVFMPIVGGVLMSSVTYNYDIDAVTYRNAKLTKSDMYASQMKLVKTSMYKAIGKPDFFGEEASYQPPNEASFTGM